MFYVHASTTLVGVFYQGEGSPSPFVIELSSITALPAPKARQRSCLCHLWLQCNVGDEGIPLPNSFSFRKAIRSVSVS